MRRIPLRALLKRRHTLRALLMRHTPLIEVWRERERHRLPMRGKCRVGVSEKACWRG